MINLSYLNAQHVGKRFDGKTYGERAEGNEDNIGKSKPPEDNSEKITGSLSTSQTNGDNKTTSTEGIQPENGQKSLPKTNKPNTSSNILPK